MRDLAMDDKLVRQDACSRRRLICGCLGVLPLALVGCTSAPARRTVDDPRYCYRRGRRYRASAPCTPGPIPSAVVEQQAKQFEAFKNCLTVYFVRQRFLDAENVVGLTLDSRLTVQTIPESFVRLRLPEGRHRVVANWTDADPRAQASLEFGGLAGSLIFVEIVGSTWIWGSNYKLEMGDTWQSRGRVQRSRLVADLVSDVDCPASEPSAGHEPGGSHRA